MVEHLELAWSAGHEEDDYALGFGGELGLLRGEWIVISEELICAGEGGESGGSEADAAVLKEPAAGWIQVRSLTVAAQKGTRIEIPVHDTIPW
jgi:hypothetical protein